MTAKICAYVNQKGGVGKSSTLYHHARSAVRRGLRVLIVDLDPQGNITSVTTAETYERDQVGTADILSYRAAEEAGEDIPITDVIVPGVWEGLNVAPSNGAPLAAVQRELVVSTAPGREQRLRGALQPVLEAYDLILIDCGPAIDLLTTNALVAADAAVIVTEAALFSINGLDLMLQSINEIRAYYNRDLTIAGVIINRFDTNQIQAQMWRRELVDALDERQIPLIQPIIPLRVPIKDAMESGMGLDEWKATRGAARLADMYNNHLNTLIPEGASA